MEWISCEDRLPEESENVLIAYADIGLVSYGRREWGEMANKTTWFEADFDEFLFIEIQEGDREITHWMQLPDPPK